MNQDELERHIASLTGLPGTKPVNEVGDAATAVLKLQEKGLDVSIALPALYRAMGEWSEYASGPGMWSDNYSEEEQEREQYGPFIIKTLIAVVLRNALDNRSAEPVARAIAKTGHLSLCYEIAGEMMGGSRDLMPVVEGLVDYTAGEIGSSSTDAHAYDLLCAIQNLSYSMVRASSDNVRRYAQLVLSAIGRIEIRNSWRPFVKEQIEAVRATYEKLAAAE